MDDEHIKLKPGSKDLRSREEGALSRHKTVSSEPKQAFNIWLVGVIWVRKSKDE